MASLEEDCLTAAALLKSQVRKKRGYNSAKRRGLKENLVDIAAAAENAKEKLTYTSKRVARREGSRLDEEVKRNGKRIEVEVKRKGKATKQETAQLDAQQVELLY